jgi:hypothetical protein
MTSDPFFIGLLVGWRKYASGRLKEVSSPGAAFVKVSTQRNIYRVPVQLSRRRP